MTAGDCAGERHCSVATELNDLVAAHFGHSDLLLVKTREEEPFLRQALAVWAAQRVQDDLGASLCTGTPAARVDWTMTMQTGCVSVTSKVSTIVDINAPEFAVALIKAIGEVSLVILSGLPEVASCEVAAIVFRLAQRYPLVLAEVQNDELTQDRMLKSLRIQVAVLRQQMSKSSAQQIFSALLDRVKGSSR